jgi:malonyl CoA-acyl carrier protein transacylase
VVSAASAEPFTDIRAELAQALVRPVRWRSAVLELRRLGAARYVETGPGRVLTGLVQRTVPDVPAEALEDGLAAVSAKEAV